MRDAARPGASPGVGPGVGVGLGSLGWQLSTVAKVARARFEEQLARTGGSFTTWKVLEVLTVHGPLKQRNLAEAVGIEGPTLTRQLERLEKRGLVQRRRPRSGDRRVQEIMLTQDGIALHAVLAEAAAQANHQLVAGLSSADTEELRRTLDHILGNLRAGTATGVVRS